MKCLYFSCYFEEEENLRKHYEEYRKVKSNNYFYKQLFEKSTTTGFCLRKRYRCDAFILNETEEKNHNFLFHFQEGGSIPFEHRPIIIENENRLIRFTIFYEKHKDSYNFEQPVQLVKYFFLSLVLNLLQTVHKSLYLSLLFVYGIINRLPKTLTMS